MVVTWLSEGMKSRDMQVLCPQADNLHRHAHLQMSILRLRPRVTTFQLRDICISMSHWPSCFIRILLLQL